MNKKCGRRVQPTQYAPWRSWRLPLMRIFVLHPHTNFEVLGPYCSEDMAHFVCLR